MSPQTSISTQSKPPRNTRNLQGGLEKESPAKMGISDKKNASMYDVDPNAEPSPPKFTTSQRGNS